MTEYEQWNAQRQAARARQSARSANASLMASVDSYVNTPRNLKVITQDVESVRTIAEKTQFRTPLCCPHGRMIILIPDTDWRGRKRVIRWFPKKCRWGCK